MASVQFEHVSKRFNRVDVVRDITLKALDQEFLVLVGPSGCGKTTCLRMVAGLEEATEGEIWIGERMVNQLAPKDRDIAMVFQNYALYPHMNVYDNIAFALHLRRSPKAEIRRRVGEAAEILGIGALLQRTPKELSGGQRQRVALGRAIVRSPRVFLMDEPLSNLDAKLRVQMRAEIARLHQQVQTTFIYVTHDQTEAMTMGDRIAVLHAGTIQQIGAPHDLYEHPANKFVAGFIGSPAMNFFPGVQVEQSDGSRWLRLKDGQALKVPPELAPGLNSYIGRSIVVGLRPEHLQESRSQPTDEAGQETAPQTLTMQVDVVEHLGNEQMLYGAVGGGQVVARIGPLSAIRPGRTIELTLDMRRIHFFDARDEVCIPTRQVRPDGSTSGSHL
jgi:multiple sugar transport system ATP-binding protein